MGCKVGITGGIGSGKSVVSGILREMGYEVYDSDREAQRLMCTEREIIDALKGRFGEEVYANGKVNRQFLSGKIFGNEENIRFVNDTVHPVVCRDFAKWAEGKALAFVESAILFEAKMDRYLDRIVYVDAPVELRIQRVIKRDNTTEEQVRKRMESQQLATTYAAQHSHYVINNDGSCPLQMQIERMVGELKHITE